MSITHRLKFESERSVEEVLNNLLAGNVGLRPATYDQMKAEGLFARVSELSKISQQHFFEEYGFQPRLSLSFDETFGENRDKTLRILGKAFVFLLTEEKGNAMLFWVVDTPILKRVKSRKIQVINELEFDWLRDALDKAGLEYELSPKDKIQER